MWRCKMRNYEKWQPRNCKGKQRLCSFKYYLTTSVQDSFLGHLQCFCRTYRSSSSSKCSWNRFEYKKTGSSSKTNEEPTITIKEHTQNFPAFKSHYTTYYNQQRKYMSPEPAAEKL